MFLCDKFICVYLMFSCDILYLCDRGVCMLGGYGLCGVCRFRGVDENVFCVSRHVMDRVLERFGVSGFEALRMILRVCLYGEFRLDVSRGLWYATDFNVIVLGKIDGRCFVVCTVYYFPLFNERKNVLRLPSMRLDGGLLVRSSLGIFKVIRSFSGFTLRPLRRVSRKVVAMC